MKTRFAPSPTGFLHIGNLRTALFNYAIARQTTEGNKGDFILRLDDTDPQRSTQEFADAIKTDLEWLGLHWDRIEKQSDRIKQYETAADKLRQSGRLYECFETPVELDLKRKKQLNMGKPPVYDRSALHLTEAQKTDLRKTQPSYWRFKLDLERITWEDGILGGLSIDAASVSDPVLIRADGQFLYTLASVCDDVDFGITHIVRGSDHVTNTATQIQIITALGGEVPHFAHHSLLTGAKGEALSKRLGTLSLRDLRSNGVEPAALLSHLIAAGSSRDVALLGLADLVAAFDLADYGAVPTKYDVAEVAPLSARYLAGLNAAEVADDLAEVAVDMRDAFWLAIRDNIGTRADIAVWWQLCAEGCVGVVAEGDADYIREAMALLPARPWDEGSWREWTSAVKEATGRKGRDLFMPLRLALTGLEHGPDMSKLMPLLLVIND